MQAFTSSELFCELCRVLNTHGLYISFNNEYDSLKDIMAAAPYLDSLEHIQILSDGYGFFTGSEEEIWKMYKETVGDDGSETNKYEGSYRIYAFTVDNFGEIQTENT